MAKKLQALGGDSVLVAVDTWLGSWEHYEQSEWFQNLLMQNGYPRLYKTFLTNVLAARVHDKIVPLPLDSANAFNLLSRKGVTAQVVHIDGAHDELSVLNDLSMWWQLLEPGGYIITDDYDPEGKVWPRLA
jgi:hypothetical protein